MITSLLMVLILVVAIIIVFKQSGIARTLKYMEIRHALQSGDLDDAQRTSLSKVIDRRNEELSNDYGVFKTKDLHDRHENNPVIKGASVKKE